VAEAFFGLVFLSGFPIMCQFLLLFGKFGASAICRQFYLKISIDRSPSPELIFCMQSLHAALMRDRSLPVSA
jgi:hypothetical protein